MFFYTFWLFLLYSFGGYLLEKLYAWARPVVPPRPQVLSAAAAVSGVRPGFAGRCWLCRRI